MSALVISNQPLLRPMTGHDLAAVMEVENAAYEFPWTLPIFRDCLRVGCHCYVYESPQQGIIGHGIMSVVVDMALFLLDFARQKKARVALLEVRLSNTAAYRLYTKLGFDEVGLRKSYYPARHGREDAIILARDLTVDKPFREIY